MGNLSSIAGQTRDAGILSWLVSALQDLCHGVILLWRDAGVSTLIVALGIGGAAAIFNLLKAAYLDPLPFRDAAHLVTITENTGWIQFLGVY